MIRKSCGCLIFIILLFFALVFLINIKFEDREDYKKAYLDETLELAKSVSDRYDLFTSVVLAQSALESNYGKSELSQNYNNYFGIKGKAGSEDAVYFETTEVNNGKAQKVKEPFKSFLSKNDSFNYYGKLITGLKRYENVVAARDFREAARALQEGGYATDPSYADKIISIVEKYELGQFDSPKP